MRGTYKCRCDRDKAPSFRCPIGIRGENVLLIFVCLQSVELQSLNYWKESDFWNVAAACHFEQSESDCLMLDASNAFPEFAAGVASGSR